MPPPNTHLATYVGTHAQTDGQVESICLLRPIGLATGTLPAIKPEATAIGIITRWPLENNVNA